jgi:hypothetical protein
MKIKVKNNAVKPSPKPFPKLMIGEGGSLVLFRKDSCGTKIYGGAGSRVARYSTTWVMGRFSDFDGELTISND